MFLLGRRHLGMTFNTGSITTKRTLVFSFQNINSNFRVLFFKHIFTGDLKTKTPIDTTKSSIIVGIIFSIITL